MRHLFSSFAARWAHISFRWLSFSVTPNPFSHTAVMEMEVKFFHKKFPGKDPKPLMDHLQKLASGEAPFFLAY